MGKVLLEGNKEADSFKTVGFFVSKKEIVSFPSAFLLAVGIGLCTTRLLASGWACSLNRYSSRHNK
jgi:hypothetical protein